MRIPEQRNPVGLHRGGLTERLRQNCIVLKRQAIHQVEIDRIDTALAQAGHGPGNVVTRLYAADRGLHLRIKGLHTQTGLDDADAANRGQPGWRQAAGIDLDRNHRPGHSKIDQQRIDQPHHFVRVDRVRAAPAKGNARYFDRRMQQTRHAANFRMQRVKIRCQTVGTVRRRSVAPAIPADFLTKRDMHIERDIAAHRGQRLALWRFKAFVAEFRRCRITRIPWNRLRQQFGVICPVGEVFRRHRHHPLRRSIYRR